MIPQIAKKGPGGVTIISYLLDTFPVCEPAFPEIISIIGIVKTATILMISDASPYIPAPWIPGNSTISQ